MFYSSTLCKLPRHWQATCICVHYWSAVVYKAEATVKFSELPIILTYLIFYLAIKQYFPSVAVVFGANLSLKWGWLKFPNGDQRSGWSTNSQINVFYAYQFSVFGNEAMPMAYLHFCTIWCLSLASELQVGHPNYSWNILSSPLTYWLPKLLTSFYFTIYTMFSIYTSTKVSLC